MTQSLDQVCQFSTKSQNIQSKKPETINALGSRQTEQKISTLENPILGTLFGSAEPSKLWQLHDISTWQKDEESRKKLTKCDREALHLRRGDIVTFHGELRKNG
jgi:hypothetical protein